MSALRSLLSGRLGVVRLCLGLVILLLCVSAVSATIGYSPPEVHPVSIDREPPGDTVISVQGYNIWGVTNPQKPARLLSVAPNGSLGWHTSGDQLDVSWFYDVDPLANGDLLVVGTIEKQKTRVLRVEPDTGTVKWSETLPLWDTHDITLTENGNLLVANMRNTENGTSNDRLYVYNRTTDEIDWEWRFRDHYPNETDAGVSSDDWTHVNDVDIISPGLYMVSPRNFDEVIVINRSTNKIVMRLGEDESHSTLYEQHNPSYLQGPDGRPTFLVADSENDRVVEYACDRADSDHPLDGDMKPNCDWNQTWEAGVDQLSWPRDADRLPTGNTLITDTLNHRVIEISPNGTVVWEYSAPWLPYDVERPAHGHEPDGPTMQELNQTGSHSLTNGSVNPRQDITGPKLTDQIATATEGVPGDHVIAAGLDRFSKVAPWIRPVWLSPNGFFLLSCGALVGVVWGGGEFFIHRGRISTVLRRHVCRLRTS
ncbi:aryl-sulfate sulfotransferase [Halocatena pleomorpha]|uniref:ArsR family transcriptional regulator n=1 Tax=Halocatena pleomorpha TaxID=1785090 RepID=A0A3P3RL57_9EURY|nr:aryl-sulfate sulfotransferase [Halocatena pleomorpha]RRJ33600.1 hypothetical protein EIK79_02035 [Halocatena pleomorpha]